MHCIIISTLVRANKVADDGIGSDTGEYGNIFATIFLPFDLFFKPVVSGRFGRLHNR